MVVARVVRALEVVVRSIVIARSLGIEVYAQYAVISAFVHPFISVFNPNIFASLIKFGTEYKEAEQPRELVALVKLGYSVSTLLYVLCSAVIVAAAFLIFPRTVGMPGQQALVVLFGAASAASLFGMIVNQCSFCLTDLK